MLLPRLAALGARATASSSIPRTASRIGFRVCFVRLMSSRIEIGGLKVDKDLAKLVEDEIAPGTGVDTQKFWSALGVIVKDLGPRNKQLLEKRDEIQKKIDEYHLKTNRIIEMPEYKKFLTEIGYLVPEGPPFKIETKNVDPEIATVAGPQLVCPVDNPRFILNAANARWGSLMDALYGTDVVSEEDGAVRSGGYNPARGQKVFDRVHGYLDEFFPLDTGASYSGATAFSVSEGRLLVTVDGKEVALRQPAQLAGFRHADGAVSSILLANNGLHFDIQIDKNSAIGKTHPAGVKDVVIDAIADCEDSVAAVDAEDKVQVYRTWTGLMKGTLGASMSKGGKQVMRTMNEDRSWETPDKKGVTLPGRVVLLVRNVGIHLYTDAVTTADGQEIPEHFLDMMVTGLAALHDIKGLSKVKNSRAGSAYIVRPKMHGPEEVAMVSELFTRAEEALGVDKNTFKMGIMDEERRTTVNLYESMRPARERVVFINTGFLDRTGDEIHTSMEAGPVLPKAEIKKQPWIVGYENNNVDVGFKAALDGKGQIGKGMWAAPDNMRQMLTEKIGHPKSGANTAWVPSPTAATLHALHYHQVSVQAEQETLKKRAPANIDDILTPPLLQRKLTLEEVEAELDNNNQGILGYIVRWVGQGVGCSKVPDANDVQLMEDRATLRISSQHIANWLHHRVCTEEQVVASMKRMAEVVDRQNKGDPNYTPMAPHCNGIEFQAAMDMIFKGKETPNGYTEFTLTKKRREYKASKK